MASVLVLWNLATSSGSPARDTCPSQLLLMISRDFYEAKLAHDTPVSLPVDCSFISDHR